MFIKSCLFCLLLTTPIVFSLSLRPSPLKLAQLGDKALKLSTTGDGLKLEEGTDTEEDMSQTSKAVKVPAFVVTKLDEALCKY